MSNEIKISGRTYKIEGVEKFDGNPKRAASAVFYKGAATITGARGANLILWLRRNGSAYVQNLRGGTMEVAGDYSQLVA